MKCRRSMHATTLALLSLVFITLAQFVFWSCSHDQVVQNHNNSTGLPEGYRESVYAGMRYGLFVPPSYDATRSYPLIVSLHGSGDTASWDLSWYHEPIQTTDPCFVLTPKSLVANSGWGTSWMSEPSVDMKKTLEVVDSLVQEFHLNTKRLYLYGVSMGGFGVFSVLAKEPGLFAGAFAICGGGNPATARIVAQTPLWIFHGSDDRIVPVDYSRSMYQAILSADGKQVRYTEYAGVGHAAWTPAWQEPSLQAWLLAQEKGVVHDKPDTVENLRYEITQTAHVKLRWAPPSALMNPDNQIWYYKLFRDFSLLAELDNVHTAFVDSSVAHASTHLYNLSAVNYFFMESGRTSPIAVPVPAHGP